MDIENEPFSMERLQEVCAQIVQSVANALRPFFDSIVQIGKNIWRWIKNGLGHRKRSKQERLILARVQPRRPFVKRVRSRRTGKVVVYA